MQLPLLPASYFLYNFICQYCFVQPIRQAHTLVLQHHWKWRVCVYGWETCDLAGLVTYLITLMHVQGHACHTPEMYVCEIQLAGKRDAGKMIDQWIEWSSFASWRTNKQTNACAFTKCSRAATNESKIPRTMKTRANQCEQLTREWDEYICMYLGINLITGLEDGRL